MAVLAVPIALAGALFIAVGFVVQQHVAAAQPPNERLSFRLLAHLARHRLWLAGIATMVVGQLLGATALGEGGLALVQPIMAVNLLFALALSALWRRHQLGRREWAGALLLVSGLAAFIAAGDPHGGSTRDVGVLGWALSGGAIAATAALLVGLARRKCDAEQATLLAGAAGTLYGLQDALTTRTIAQLGGGVVHLLSSWPAFALVSVAVTALMLGQSAFEAAPLDASLPAITAAEPLTAIGMGAGLFGEHLSLSAGLLGVELVGLAVMVVGVYLVASSPVVTGNHAAVSPRETAGSQQPSR